MKYLAIDNGGTFIKYAVMDESGNILEKGKEPTPDHKKTAEDYFHVLDQIVLPRKQEIEGIAFSTPGQVDVLTGFLHTAGGLVYLMGLNLCEEIEKRYHLPSSVDNDAKCAAMAEQWNGSLKGVKNGAVIVLGTGVGMGIIIDGKLYRGTNYTAGEISFLNLYIDKPKHSDSYMAVNGSSLALGRTYAKETGIDPSEIDGHRMFELINEGDETACRVLRNYVQKLAGSIYNFQTLLDLEIFAIGGGISQQPVLLEEIKKEIDYLFEAHPSSSYGMAVKKPKITACQYYNDSNLRGALYHFLNRK
ncbi:sugar kinase [Lacrimispora xylanolytica]|jgi:predicted NBD/HSP70 family sugar kinase|uniref:ROK family protein n=1 Tax=Lacrimispora xylanolytica TaxID=29375 RepID=A0ABY7AI05_9FIRM|nr:ROK family protein [Lacrimispora xylanolytica]MBS5957272.1 ROK family protein [Clostridiales bacterium]WAJ25116.1 ROK family protein [Lacrimispora xylanolytica]